MFGAARKKSPPTPTILVSGPTLLSTISQSSSYRQENMKSTTSTSKSNSSLRYVAIR